MHQVDLSSKLIGSNFDLGSQGSKGFLLQKRGDLVHPPNLTRALGKGRMSSFFFLLSFFLTICFFFHMLDRIFTKLGQKQVWVDGYKTYGSKNSSGVIWGHRGQKDDFTKNATPPTDYMVWSGD